MHSFIRKLYRFNGKKFLIKGRPTSRKEEAYSPLSSIFSSPFFPQEERRKEPLLFTSPFRIRNDYFSGQLVVTQRNEGASPSLFPTSPFLMRLSFPTWLRLRPDLSSQSGARRRKGVVEWSGQPAPPLGGAGPAHSSHHTVGFGLNRIETKTGESQAALLLACWHLLAPSGFLHGSFISATP